MSRRPWRTGDVSRRVLPEKQLATGQVRKHPATDVAGSPGGFGALDATRHIAEARQPFSDGFYVLGGDGIDLGAKPRMTRQGAFSRT